MTDEQKGKIGKILLEAREAKGLHRDELAQATGYSVGTIYGVESGRQVNAKTVQPLASFLGVTLPADLVANLPWGKGPRRKKKASLEKKAEPMKVPDSQPGRGRMFGNAGDLWKFLTSEKGAFVCEFLPGDGVVLAVSEKGITLRLKK